jgi:hypothetical protein
LAVKRDDGVVVVFARNRRSRETSTEKEGPPFTILSMQRGLGDGPPRLGFTESRREKGWARLGEVERGSWATGWLAI